MEPLKVLFVGDPKVGKTCLIIRLDFQRFPESIIPTQCDNSSTTVVFRGREVTVGLWDVRCGEEFAPIHPWVFPGAHAVLLCFDIANRASFEHVETRWMPEIREHLPGVPALLVGLKSDVRLAQPSSPPLVSTGEAEELAKRLGCVECLECSALSAENTTLVLETTLEHIVGPEKPTAQEGKAGGCSVV